ncbi:type II secretion system protein [Shewanella sp. 202IG2-18]|uniref:type II secretion system protein n=1 Tax=Parashewanella hymeniacidonis TaxID=2807618 RepID=UPI00195F8A32|nr:type II secretion system protein [Parashewanella hymeniacidonis]MBM7074563.1 type II secretion system protein [Parashewanella hymeniacidonis]
MIKRSGFTLIELVVVMVILGILAIITAPKFLSLSSDAKINVINQIKASAKAANDHIQVFSKLPNHAPHPSPNHANRNDISVITIDNEDFLLKCGFLDDRNLVKRLQLSSDNIFVAYEGDDKAYFGFEASNIQSNQCYFMYQQSYTSERPTICNSSAPNYQPVYQVVTTGC